ncbi:MAG: transposase [Synergistaceae bacterium]|nr:transposase [Synergistaceae bacterium]MBQ3398351.1 transposase [Synergistaceae bacterium]MBQ6418650.1 transposase [Synergistaceae bacterium]
MKGWHEGLFGRTVQHSVLGLVKKKLMNSERVIVLPQSMPTTKYCPKYGNLKKDIKLSDRVYECECGYHEDRDVHAAISGGSSRRQKKFPCRFRQGREIFVITS